MRGAVTGAEGVTLGSKEASSMTWGTGAWRGVGVSVGPFGCQNFGAASAREAKHPKPRKRKEVRILMALRYLPHRGMSRKPRTHRGRSEPDEFEVLDVRDAA